MALHHGAMLVVLLVAIAAVFAAIADPADGDRKAERDARIAWWREARFGMFIHWGLYALPAGEWKGQPYSGIGEWIMFKARIPLAEYEELAEQFNPTRFDAEAWAQLAQDAGMRYLVITAKHHDGFAMYHSHADSFNIVDATPFHRDPLQELAAACATRGIRFGVYYSQAQDWHAPGGAIWQARHEDGPVWEKKRWDPRQEGDFDAYLERKAIPQVRELLTHYGPIAIIWFDTPLDVMTVERADRLEKLVHELQPGCLVSGRLGGKSQADYDSEGDNRIPAAARPGDWETPATLNHTWGYKKDDHDWKTPEELVFNLVDIVSKGGNYLLNVGPTAEGIIPEPSQESLRGVGRWMKVNSEAIYGCGATPFGGEFGSPSPTEKDDRGNPRFIPAREWRCTSKPGKLYLHLFRWRRERFELVGLKQRVRNAFLLADPNRAPLPFTQSGEDLTLTLPPQPPDSVASVVCLEI